MEVKTIPEYEIKNIQIKQGDEVISKIPEGKLIVLPHKIEITIDEIQYTTNTTELVKTTTNQRSSIIDVYFNIDDSDACIENAHIRHCTVSSQKDKGMLIKDIKIFGLQIKRYYKTRAG